MSERITEAISSGLLPDRVWAYSNYNCNLECTYCLTESAPGSPKRMLSADRIVGIAAEAAALGFRELGITGGEPLLMTHLPDTLAVASQHLPILVLTNGMLCEGPRLERLAALAGKPVAFQISLDSADPARNDLFRGMGCFAKAVAGIRNLREAGLRVRIATTLEGDVSADEREALCALHRSFGIDDDDHLVRPVLRAGRAHASGGATSFSPEQIPPELCITADGAFWSPFGPTITNGRLDLALLISRVTTPLARPAEMLVGLLEGRPAGADAQIGIR